MQSSPWGEDGAGSSRRGRPDQEGQQRIGLSSSNMPQPLLPIPEPLRANEVGTFAEDSVVRRLPEIALRTAEENRLDGEHLELVEALAHEINTATLSHIDEPEAPDRAAWRDYVEPHLGSTTPAPWTAGRPGSRCRGSSPRRTSTGGCCLRPGTPDPANGAE